MSSGLSPKNAAELARQASENEWATRLEDIAERRLVLHFSRHLSLDVLAAIAAVAAGALLKDAKALRGAKMFMRVGVPVLGIVENMGPFTDPASGIRYAFFAEGGGERLAAEVGTELLCDLTLRGESRTLRAALVASMVLFSAGGAIGSFGAPRNGGRIHRGLDVLARCGTPLVAARSGVVVRRRSNPRLDGNFVVVSMDKERMTYRYSHLIRPAKPKPGDHVSTGEVLGYVGKTGNAASTPCPTSASASAATRTAHRRPA